MKRNKKVLAAGLALVGAVILTGCTTATASDEVAVHYGGGPFEAKKAKGCISSSERETSKPGDSYYYYPANQRTYDFTGDADSDAAPIQVVSKDNQPLSIPGQINFDMITDCKTLTAFHDNIGKRYQAYMDDGKGGHVQSDGWKKVLNLYIGRAADATLDRVAKQYTWRELYSDPAIKDELNAAVNETIARLVDQQTDGDQTFFSNYSALLKQPEPAPELVDALKAEETGRAQAAAVEAKAIADANAAQAAAEAQVAQKNAEALVAEAQARIDSAKIAPFGSVEAYNNYQAIQKGLNPFQPTYGGSPIVAPK